MLDETRPLDLTPENWAATPAWMRAAFPLLPGMVAELPALQGRVAELEARPETRSIDVWLVNIRGQWHLSNAASSLSPEERARASRFRFEHDRRHFIASHHALRSILSGYLGTEPGALQFVLNSYGKPSLVGSRDQDIVHFNLSHAGQLALVAVDRHFPVGVDLELCKPLSKVNEIALRCLAAHEAEAWSRVAPERRHDLFYKLWTHKEALLKGLGVGLSYGLGSLTVLSPEGNLLERVTVSTEAGTQVWVVRMLQTPHRYTAALATPAHAGPVLVRQFNVTWGEVSSACLRVWQEPL